MMKKALCTAMMILMGAQAMASETRIEKKTVTTGNEKIIRLSVGRCSIPSQFPYSGNVKSMMVSSQVDYKVCREYSTSDYEVSGSFWNKSANEVSGTAILSYKLEDASKGQSFFLSNQNGIEPMAHLSTYTSVIGTCSTIRELLLSQQVDLAQTNCR